MIAKEEVFLRMRATGIIPVVVLDNVKDALSVADALVQGGLLAAEITFRTDAAAKAITLMKQNYPQMLIGAGTVLTKEQVDAAVAAGAEFVVSPGANPTIMNYCNEVGVTMLPGTATASDIERALECNMTHVKFFPAEINGGLKAIKTFAAPYTNVDFMPTGGINSENVGEYLSYDRIIACGGTWMVKSDLIQKQQFDQIAELSSEAARLVKKNRG